MSDSESRKTDTQCPSCGYGPFTRNHYFNGKLLVERDFTDEQSYHREKMMHHHQRLHGWGVVCGLKIRQHPNEACRDRFVILEPGTAIDCCGHEILVKEKKTINFTKLPGFKAYFDDRPPEDQEPVNLLFCIRYKECPAKPILVLYDECGCDDTQCTPNKILECYEIDVNVNPVRSPGRLPGDVHPGPAKGAMLTPESTQPWREEPLMQRRESRDCDDLLVSECPGCEQPNCVGLATAQAYLRGRKLVDLSAENPPAEDSIPFDNRKGRKILPSIEGLKAWVECRLRSECSGGGGEPGAGIDDVEVEIIDCDQDGLAEIQNRDGQRILFLRIPRGCDGEKGEPGQPGKPGPGLEKGLLRIQAISWTHGGRGASSLVDVLKVPDSPSDQGLVIAFTGDIQAIDDFNAKQIFQVFVEAQVQGAGAWQKFRLEPERIVLVDPVVSGGRVTSAVYRSGDHAQGLAFMVPENFLPIFQQMAYTITVLLFGDFVLEYTGDSNKPARAIDAEFVRGELPTGDRPKGSRYGIQGGVFRSWFNPSDQAGNQPPGHITVPVDFTHPLITGFVAQPATKVSINTASATRLIALPGLGRAKVAEIIKARPIRNLEELAKVHKISEKDIEAIRNLITFETEGGN